MRVTFLGTSAGVPTASRHLPAVLVSRKGELILLDCGEGTQSQLRAAGARTGRLSAICISHLHGDHVLGLPGLLMSLQLNARTAPLAIHGPPGVAEFVGTVLRLTQAHVAYPLEIVEHETAGIIARRPDYRLECAPLEHRSFCLGYAIVEEGRPGRLDQVAAARLGVPPGPLLGRLKAGEEVSLPGGARVRPEQVLGPAPPGKRVAYCTDTRPCDAGVGLALEADLLIHESTFASDRADDARLKSHSTAAEAAGTALRAGAHNLALTHISPRYGDAAPLLQEARAVFPDTIVAEDLLAIEV